MPDDTTHRNPQLEHLRINLQEDVHFRQTTNGLERFRFVHQALPDLALDQVDLRTSFFGKALKAPLLI
ncbi:MAG: type 2 isopentenyl-diphosphate Delta-isomerase, partial [Chloroflexi bacterium]|nr:type 2 isopentenyl-diphosphate Delta-isomerase [Chloroflexota bacterium]